MSRKLARRRKRFGDGETHKLLSPKMTHDLIPIGAAVAVALISPGAALVDSEGSSTIWAKFALFASTYFSVKYLLR